MYRIEFDSDFDKGRCIECPLSHYVRDPIAEVKRLVCVLGYFRDECPLEEVDDNTGEWIISSDGYYPYCSECKHRPDEMSHFCPECGADMRGV